MPTSSDFVVVNGTQSDVQKLDLALQYLSTSTYAHSMLQMLQYSSVKIEIIHDKQTVYDSNTNTIRWDPDAGLTVADKTTMTATGVQSAALGLIHEAAHALDPNLDVHRATPDANYYRESERIAVETENIVAQVLGETQRFNADYASLPTTYNPTTHTNPSNQWEQQAPWGETEYGSYWNGVATNYAPEWGSGGCVEVSSHLPSGFKAGDVAVGDELELSDEKTLEAGRGSVSFSKRKEANGYRITTESGVSLVCSDTAPIPTPEGLRKPHELKGSKVAVRVDEDGQPRIRWEAVASVDSIGKIQVQHLTVGDKCFWAGERAGAYILHHNIKMEEGPYDPPPWWDLVAPSPVDAHASRTQAPMIEIVGYSINHIYGIV